MDFFTGGVKLWTQILVKNILMLHLCDLLLSHFILILHYCLLNVYTVFVFIYLLFIDLIFDLMF